MTGDGKGDDLKEEGVGEGAREGGVIDYAALLDAEEELSEEERRARDALARLVARVEADGLQLGQIPVEDRSREVCRAAVVSDGRALQFVPQEERDMYLCQKACRSKGAALEFVPPMFLSKPVCLMALRRDGLALRFVPEETRDRDVCLTAILQNSDALQYVPKELVDEDLCVTAMRVDGRALEFVPDALRSADICYEACRTSGLALPFVPKELLSPLLRVRGLFAAAASAKRRMEIDCETPPDWEELRKSKPREEWGRFEKWSFKMPDDFPCPEDFHPGVEEVKDFLMSLLNSFAEEAGMPDFAADEARLVPGKSFWLEVERDGDRRRIYAPGLALLAKLELDGHGVPKRTGAFTAASALMDWKAGWKEVRPKKEAAGS